MINRTKKGIVYTIVLAIMVYIMSVAPAAGTNDLKVQYQCGDPTAPTDNAIRPYLQIVNNGTTSVDLSTLTVRYWYTKDSASSETFTVDYQGTLSSKSVITGTFGDNANGHYMEVGFTASAGSIAAAGNTGRIKVRANKSDWSNYSETDDYSYDPSKTALADWNKITLYQNGTLIWGIEPGGSSTPTPTPTPTTTPTPTPTPTPNGNVINCATAAEIQNALTNAKAGDRIVIKSGTYTGAGTSVTTGGGSATVYFYASNSGTASQHITIESETPSNPAVLQGAGTASGYVLYITGDYWDVNDLKITNAQKGIMLDHANYTLLSGVNVYNIGMEGIHFRDGSSNNKVQNSVITNTGVVDPGFGEGIYVGSDYSVWSSYNRTCNNNEITGCTVGPDVRAEHLDIKEGTFGTKVTNNTFLGQGISGANYADSFIDVKGRDVNISSNNFYKQNNNIIVATIAEVVRPVDASLTSNGSLTDTSDGNIYSNNTTYAGNP
jgi:hypothetical protein